MTDLPNSLTGANEMPQIVAPDSPLPDQLWAAVRQVAPPVVAFLVGRHLIQNDFALLLAGLGGVVWPIVQGQLTIRHRVTQLVTIGNDPRVSDRIVTTESKAASAPVAP